jgi:hypothetical protein
MDMKTFKRAVFLSMVFGMAALPGAGFAYDAAPEAKRPVQATGDQSKNKDFALMARPAEECIRRMMYSSEGINKADVAFFRGYGLKGLDAVLGAMAQHPENHNLKTAADMVAQQKNAADSRLFWHTDLKSALAAAQKENKPILYLRLLGNLTDEYSCANSRYFRTVLYADPSVSARLRDRYVLVWESERPVPVMTIDFGDGRKVKQTITGNSVHYVLTKEGVVMDAMPGLYSPQAFLSVLDSTRIYERYGAEAYHTRVRDSLLRDGGTQVNNAMGVQEAAPAREAAVAMANTQSKAKAEMPMLRALSPEYAAKLADAIKDARWEAWEKVGADRPVKLSKESVAVIARQIKTTETPQADLEAVVRKLERNIATETARNEYVMRRQVHEWFLEKEPVKDLNALNTRVYADLFLTPKTDPWLGLVDPEAYTGLTVRGSITRKGS